MPTSIKGGCLALYILYILWHLIYINNDKYTEKNTLYAFLG